MCGAHQHQRPAAIKAQWGSYQTCGAACELQNIGKHGMPKASAGQLTIATRSAASWVAQLRLGVASEQRRPLRLVRLVVIVGVLRHGIFHPAGNSKRSFVSYGLQLLLKFPAAPAHYEQFLVFNSVAMTKRTHHHILIRRMTHDEASTRGLSAHLYSTASS